MKKLLFFFAVLFLVACTSNTILKKPEDLIPRDTMVLLIYDLHLANAAKHVKNKNLEKKVNYMPLVFDKYKIDSLRFQTSNSYYISKIDEYDVLYKNVKASLEAQKKVLEKQEQKQDSLQSK